MARTVEEISADGGIASLLTVDIRQPDQLAGGGRLESERPVPSDTRGVRVNAVAPGTIYSSGMDTYDDEIRAAAAEHASNIPAGRVGTESEASAAVVFLLSPTAAFITGETLKVDGGSSLSKMPLAPVSAHDAIPPPTASTAPGNCRLPGWAGHVPDRTAQAGSGAGAATLVVGRRRWDSDAARPDLEHFLRSNQPEWHDDAADDVPHSPASTSMRRPAPSGKPGLVHRRRRLWRWRA